jgi:hypothetical protein
VSRAKALSVCLCLLCVCVFVCSVVLWLGIDVSPIGEYQFLSVRFLCV